MTEKGNTFSRLKDIDVSKHVEKKGNFSYLSWPYAVQKLREACSDATWEVKHFFVNSDNGATGQQTPYMKTECGYFVEVAVTVDGITLSQVHPVLDNTNKTIEEPNAFDINTSIQRCLVKAIALHGLGLNIYAGEDLPDNKKSNKKPDKKPTFVEIMVKEADRVGDEIYFKILGGNGFESASEIMDKKTQTKIYLELKTLPNKKEE